MFAKRKINNVTVPAQKISLSDYIFTNIIFKIVVSVLTTYWPENKRVAEKKI